MGKTMEMPVNCQHCTKIFDLNDGYASEKWYPNIVICEPCHEKEYKEIAIDEEIADLKIELEDAKFDCERITKRLKELNVNTDEIA